MQKIIKLSQNLENLRLVRFVSRYQFKVESPIYYPKRDLSEDDSTVDQMKMPGVGHPNDDAHSVDYYKVLGLNRGALSPQIKAAYYELAKKIHPDAKPTPQETKTFQQISEAYRVLSDEYTRKEYDKYGFVKNIIPASKEEKEKVASNLFNVERNKLRNHKIPDKREKKVALTDIARTGGINEVELEMKFLEAIQGGKEYVELKGMVKCPKCNGASRLGRQVNVEFCQKCGGTGQYRDRRSIDVKWNVCDCCEGKRYITKNSCEKCESRGFIVQTAKVEVIIPPGSNDGDTILIMNPVNNKQAKVRLIVDKSNYFKREGNNIYTDKYITISQAVLGGNFKIRGLYGDHDINLGPGIESHTVHCFKGKGICTKTAIPGDHFVVFKIRIPKILTTKQRQLILALSRTEEPTFDGQR